MRDEELPEVLTRRTPRPTTRLTSRRAAAPASIRVALDALHGAPLEAFVAERKRLGGELKRDGAPGEAARFLALGKPTVSAWLTNQTS